MSTPDIGSVLHASGRLSINPTTKTGIYPWGGTALGLIQDIVIKPTRQYVTIREEAFGPEVIDVLDLGESWILAATLRGFDTNANSIAWASPVAGSVSGKYGPVYPNPDTSADSTKHGTFRPGTLKYDTANKLLFTPDDPYSVPFVLFYAAIPMLEEAAALKLAINNEYLTPVVFHAVRSSTSKLVAVQRFEDLSLT